MHETTDDRNLNCWASEVVNGEGQVDERGSTYYSQYSSRWNKDQSVAIECLINPTEFDVVVRGRSWDPKSEISRPSVIWLHSYCARVLSPTSAGDHNNATMDPAEAAAQFEALVLFLKHQRFVVDVCVFALSVAACADDSWFSLHKVSIRIET